MVKVYIAGPMRNIPFFNFPAFESAAETLRDLGFHVFSPAELDKIYSPQDVGNPSGHLEATPIHDYIRRDAHVIINELKPPLDCLVMLPGWEKSTGAKAEHGLALWCRLQVYHYRNVIEQPEMFREIARGEI